MNVVIFLLSEVQISKTDQSVGNRYVMRFMPWRVPFTSLSLAWLNLDSELLRAPCLPCPVREMRPIVIYECVDTYQKRTLGVNR